MLNLMTLSGGQCRENTPPAVAEPVEVRGWGIR